MTDRTHEHIDDVISHCIHCGLCLPVCPTYALTSNEQSSPRGRIRLIRSVRDGSLALSDEFVDEMNFCLDCQACQTACPAGVQYGSLVEDARQLIATEGKETWNVKLVKAALLRVVLASNSRTKLAGRLLRLYERSGLRAAVEQSGILNLVSSRIGAQHSLLPPASELFFDESIPEVLPPVGSRRGRVLFLSGCIMNISFADIHRDSVAVLRRNGFEVITPKLQTCCGSLHGHNGDLEMAQQLARTNVDVFSSFDADALIVDSAGCGAFLKEYGTLLAGEPLYADRARALAARTKDISEFLVEVGFEKPRTPIRTRVTYHEACHLVHTQKISLQPREIIQSIPGIEFVELPEATWCCGSAGMYNIVRFDDSMKLLERKLQHIASVNADFVATANPGCHLQISYGLKRTKMPTRICHPVSLLAMAYREA